MGMNKNKLNVWLLVLLGAGLATGGAVLLAPARTNSESEDPTELVPESKLKPRRGASGARGESGVQGLDLLDLVRTPEDAVAGVWGFQNAALISSNIRRSRLQIPCLLPEEYDLKAVVTRKAGTNAFSLGFVLKGKQGLIVLDGLDGHTSWLFLATAPDHESNPTRTTGKALRWNKPAEILLSVRKGRVRMTVDGKVRLDWTADPGELFMPSEFAVPDQRLLTVGSWESNYRIDELRLIPVTGSAQPLR